MFDQVEFRGARAEPAVAPRRPATAALTTITAPPAPGAVLSRDRLFDRLDAALDRSLAVVSGPPGAGKTLLVTTWLDRREPPGTRAWVSIDRSLAHPGRFWRAVLDAVALAGERTLETLTIDAPFCADDFMPALANAITALSRPLVLVLDDFHAMRSPAVSRQLDSLLRFPMGNLTVIIVTRADPQLSLRRLHLENRVLEVRAGELAFTLEETLQLFEVAGLELSGEHVAALHARTEGWVAGLRLAALLLGARNDVDSFVQTFAGDESSVAGYLVEEVLRHQRSDVREFMLRTSVVDEFTTDLASALAPKTDAALIIDELESAGAFLMRVDQRGSCYRYHLMFRELLRVELRHRMPSAFALQHRRAARWFAEQRLHAAATRHALAAEDWELAADLLSRDWLALLAQGQSSTVAAAVARLPRALVIQRPELSLAAGGSMLDAGETDLGLEWLTLAEEQSSAIAPARRSHFVSGRGIAAAYAHGARQDFAASASTCRRLLAGHGSGVIGLSGHDRRALVLTRLGVAETWVTSPEHGSIVLEEALALGRHTDRPYLTFLALGPLSLAAALSGSLRRAQRLADEAAALADCHGWNDRAAAAYCATAICAYHRNALGEAVSQLDRASATARRLQDRAVLTVVELFRARIAHRRQDSDAAMMAILAARAEGAGWRLPPWLTAALVGGEAEALLASGRTHAAQKLLDGPTADAGGTLAMVRARLALATGNPKEAAEAAANWTDRTVARPTPAAAAELQALRAVAEHRRGDDEVALSCIEAALDGAEVEACLSPFLSIGPPIRELVARRIRAGTAHRALAEQVLDALDPRAAKQSPSGGMLVLDPLSERELTVLRYLPTRLSKPEIASELFVSVNTVKTHVKNIYRKLGVTGRSQAVRRARRLRLI